MAWPRSHPQARRKQPAADADFVMPDAPNPGSWGYGLGLGIAPDITYPK